MHALARGTLAVTLLSVALASGASAQASYPNVKLAGRLQEQIYYFDNDFYAPVGVGPNSNIFTRRARIEARGEISENVTVFIQPSFEGGRNLSSVSTTCTSTPVPAQRAQAPRCLDRRPVHQGGEQVLDLLPRGPGEAAFQPL
jgi:hypothetical protein